MSESRFNANAQAKRHGKLVPRSPEQTRQHYLDRDQHDYLRYLAGRVTSKAHFEHLISKVQPAMRERVREQILALLPARVLTEMLEVTHAES